MWTKIKSHIKWVILLMIVIFGFIGLSYYSADKSELTLSPEAVFGKATTSNASLISFSFKPSTVFPVFSAELKSESGIKTVNLEKKSTGVFRGSMEVPKQLLNKPQTITFQLYINRVKTSKILRLAITDVLVSMPQDPGEAGKQTLEGIDSDNDGVRDDLQREIVFMYPGKDEVRRVLRAMVKKAQQLITTTGDHEYFKGLMVEYFAFRHCYEYQVFRSQREITDNTNGDILWYMGQNTSERKRIIEASQYKATPFGSAIYSGPEACTQPLVQGQY